MCMQSVCHMMHRHLSYHSIQTKRKPHRALAELFSAELRGRVGLPVKYTCTSTVYQKELPQQRVVFWPVATMAVWYSRRHRMPRKAFTMCASTVLLNWNCQMAISNCLRLRQLLTRKHTCRVADAATSRWMCIRFQ